MSVAFLVVHPAAICAFIANVADLGGTRSLTPYDTIPLLARS